MSADSIPTQAVILRPVNPETLIAQAIEKGVDVATMERLLAMRRELRQEAAKESFDRALSDFQSTVPTIQKTKKVFVKGALRYCYAPLEAIVQQVREPLKTCGFSYTLDAQVEPGWVTATCKLTHAMGHSETSQFKVPIQNDAYMGEAQKFASALTFAKRYAFVNSLGIMTSDEDDDSQATQENHPHVPPTTQPATPKPKDAPKANSGAKKATPAKAADVLPKAATEATRKWFLTEMEKSGVDFGELHDWAVQQSFLIPNEALDDWPLHKVPTSRQEFGQLLKQFEQWQKGNAPQAKEDEPWRSVPIPGWSKHVKEDGFKTFGDLPKEKLWWWCVKWQPVCDEHGKVSSKDFDLRQMLDEVNEKYLFSNPVGDDVAY